MRRIVQRLVAGLLGLVLLLLPVFPAAGSVRGMDCDGSAPAAGAGAAGSCCSARSIRCCNAECCLDPVSKRAALPKSTPVPVPSNPLPDWVSVRLTAFELPAPVADRVPSGTMVLRGRHDPTLPLFLRDRLLLL